MKKEKVYLDHVDVVVTHLCNNNCEHCIDKFVNKSTKFISLKTVKKFLKTIRKHTKEPLEVLLLGGEPTTMPEKDLIKMAKLCHRMGFKIIMSTNGKLTKRIEHLLPYFDSIQITISTEEEIERWRLWEDKVNIKLAGDSSLTFERLAWFVKKTEGYARRSISMYFTPDFEECCQDENVWALLETLEWKRNGSYMYAFYKGVRIKKCIHGETNIIDEPSVPKVYPNGNYNKTWDNENLDDYLNGHWNRPTSKDIMMTGVGTIWVTLTTLGLIFLGILSLPVLGIMQLHEICQERRKRKHDSSRRGNIFCDDEK